jgi:hypothetical protein
MKLPLHTTSAPLAGKEARRVINAVNAGRAVSNARAKAFAAECSFRLNAPSITTTGWGLPESSNAIRSGRDRTNFPMPKLSRFFGIDIYMPSRESNHRLAHFHAKYASQKVSIAIGTLEVLAGNIPAKELAMVRGWAFEHRAELQRAWKDLRAGRTPGKIQGLE